MGTQVVHHDNKSCISVWEFSADFQFLLVSRASRTLFSEMIPPLAPACTAAAMRVKVGSEFET